MLKRMLLILLALLLALPAMAEESLMEQYAAKAAQELPLLAGNEWYATLYTGVGSSYDRVSDLLAGYAAQMWKKPTRDVYLSVDAAAIMAMIEAEGVVGLDEGTMAYIRQQMPMLISTQLTIPRSYEALMVGQVVGTTLRYTDPAQPEGLMVFIRFFEDGAPLLYSVNCVDGAVVLSCGVLPENEQSDDVQVKVWGSDIPDELLAELTEQGLITVVETPEEEQPALALADCKSAEDVTRWLAQQETMFIVASDAPVMMEVPQSIGKGVTHAETAILLAQKTAQRAANKTMMAMMTESAEMTGQLLEWASGDYSRPRLMVEAPVDVQTHGASVWGSATAMALAAAEEDDPARRALSMMLPDTLMMSIMNVNLRVDYIALHSISSYGGMYADPAQPDGTGMYILLYEDGQPVCVTWTCQNGTVSMQAKFLPLEGLADCRTATDVSLWFMSQGVPVACRGIPIN